MSKREKWMVYVIAGLVGFFVLDLVLLRPALAWVAAQSAAHERLTGELRDARLLVDNAEIIRGRWGALAAAGLNADEDALRLRAQENLSVWAQESGFALTTLVSGQTLTLAADDLEGRNAPRFDEIRFTAAGSGTLAATTDFLQRLGQSPFPLRLLDLDVTSRSETTDAVGVRATLSVLRSPGGEVAP